MITACWAQVGQDDLGGATHVRTFEREVPFGKLVMVVTVVGSDTSYDYKVSTALTFVPYDDAKPKGARKV